MSKIVPKTKMAGQSHIKIPLLNFCFRYSPHSLKRKTIYRQQSVKRNENNMSTGPTLPILRLKKKADRRVLKGHPWIFSNEIDTSVTPLKAFSSGEEVMVQTHDEKIIGVAYVNPHSLISARLFSEDLNVRLDRAFFENRLQDAYQLRERLFSKPFYRLVFSEADRLPGLVIDRFGQHIVCQINTAGLENKKALITDAICSLLPDTESILFRNDSQIRELEGLTCYTEPGFGTPPKEVMIQENDTDFAVPLWQGQKTGWFYDHRQNRARLKSYVKNQTVLDVFSYLGGFGLQAAKFGAKRVDCIDASAFAIDYTKKNAQLNHVSDKVNVICADAFDALKLLRRDNKQYDVIILDPPAFVKKSKDRQAGIIAYLRLNALALTLLSPQGILVTCSCSMHITMDDLIEIVQRASVRTHIPLQILERGHQGPDHPIHPAIPETDYLKALFVRKNN